VLGINFGCSIARTGNLNFRGVLMVKKIVLKHLTAVPNFLAKPKKVNKLQSLMFCVLINFEVLFSFMVLLLWVLCGIQKIGACIIPIRHFTSECIL